MQEEAILNSQSIYVHTHILEQHKQPIGYSQIYLFVRMNTLISVNIRAKAIKLVDNIPY